MAAAALVFAGVVVDTPAVDGDAYEPLTGVAELAGAAAPMAPPPT